MKALKILEKSAASTDPSQKSQPSPSKKWRLAGVCYFCEGSTLVFWVFFRFSWSIFCFITLFCLANTSLKKEIYSFQYCKILLHNFYSSIWFTGSFSVNVMDSRSKVSYMDVAYRQISDLDLENRKRCCIGSLLGMSCYQTKIYELFGFGSSDINLFDWFETFIRL